MLCLLMVLWLCGSCASLGQPLVSDHSPVFVPNPTSYTVHKGDTLYSIAWRFGLDVKQLAARNALTAPYVIHPGRRLHLSPSPRSTVAVPQPQTQPPQTTSRQPTGTARIKWVAPVTAAPRQTFGANSNGLDYVLASGAVVRAAAPGTVVYAGAGLGGFRELVIIDHGADFLSAYNYHGSSRVKEQQKIQVGTPLADIENNTTASYALHFEIRLHGQPQNPDRLLRQ